MSSKLTDRGRNEFALAVVKYCLVIVLLVCSSVVKAQVGNDQVPLLPSYLWNTTSFFNPSQRIRTTDWAMTARYRGLTGALKEINQLEIGGNISLKEIHQVNAVGVFSKIGPYISVNRFGLSYAVKVPLSNMWDAVLGMSALLTQYSLASTTAGPGGSSGGFDGAFGGALIHERWEFAIATNQVFESSVRPLNFEYALNRYHQAYVSRVSDLSPDFKLGTVVYYRYLELDRDDFVGSCQLTYKDALEVGGSYHPGEGISPQLAVNYEKKALNYRLVLSYFLPLGLTTKHIRTPAYEVTLWVFQKPRD